MSKTKETIQVRFTVAKREIMLLAIGHVPKATYVIRIDKQTIFSGREKERALKVLATEIKKHTKPA